MSKLRIGIIGANIQAGWGARAHLPALLSLPEYQIVGVANTSPASARATADKFGLPNAFADVRELIEQRDVDVVAVCVRVPHHEALLLQALAAGKHVYCEWPLTVSTAQAERVLALATERGVRSAIGLQARVDPVLRHARVLLAQGLIGEVQGVSVVYSSPWPVAVPAAYALMQDAASGLSQLELSAGHTLDAVCWLLGELQECSAGIATLVKTARLVDTGETIPRTSADQIVVQGRLVSGALLSAHFLGAPGGGTGTRIEIQGSSGTLLISSASREAVQSAGLGLAHFSKGRTQPIEIPAACTLAPEAPAGAAFNVANMYRAFGAALQADAPFEHDFAAAVRRHRMLDAIRRAAAEGQRVTLS